MPTHVVRQGECLSSLGWRYGLQARDLHNHPANAELKKNRPYANILAPGDVVEIAVTRKWAPASTGRTNTFVVNRPRVKLRIVLLNALEEPYESKRFEITVGKRKVRGRTTREGLIECEVPADAESGHLRAWLDDNDSEPHIDRDLAIGHLDPVDLVAGVQARLENLGYPCTVTGDVDEATSIALHRFRARHELPDADTGAALEGTVELIDDSARKKLESLHEGR